LGSLGASSSARFSSSTARGSRPPRSRSSHARRRSSCRGGRRAGQRRRQPARGRLGRRGGGDRLVALDELADLVLVGAERLERGLHLAEESTISRLTCRPLGVPASPARPAPRGRESDRACAARPGTPRGSCPRRPGRPRRRRPALEIGLLERDALLRGEDAVDVEHDDQPLGQPDDAADVLGGQPAEVGGRLGERGLRRGEAPRSPRRRSGPSRSSPCCTTTMRDSPSSGVLATSKRVRRSITGTSVPRTSITPSTNSGARAPGGRSGGGGSRAP
jgi:hypothetical protein